jgi:hypothetical protein
MTTPTTVQIGEKVLPLWDAKQLESMNPQILRSRALDLKEAAGVETAVPRHKETLVDWIMKMQAIHLDNNMNGGMGGMGGPPPQQAQQQYQDMGGHRGMGGASYPPQEMFRNARQPGYPSPAYEPSEAGTEAQSVHLEAREGANRAKARNMGSGNIFTWS